MWPIVVVLLCVNIPHQRPYPYKLHRHCLHKSEVEVHSPNAPL